MWYPFVVPFAMLVEEAICYQACLAAIRTWLNNRCDTFIHIRRSSTEPAWSIDKPVIVSRALREPFDVAARDAGRVNPGHQRSRYGIALEHEEIERICDLYWDVVEGLERVSRRFLFTMPLQIIMLVGCLMVNMWQVGTINIATLARLSLTDLPMCSITPR